MSEEENPDLTKSWVIVDPEAKSDKTPENSGVEEISENDNSEPHADSDTDSISVISESGCSYRTDEEEFVPATTFEPENSNVSAPETPEAPEIQPFEPDEPPKLDPKSEIGKVDKLLYFATSVTCALIIIGASIAVQQYFYGSSDVSEVENDLSAPVSHYVQHVKKLDVDSENVKRSYSFKRKGQGKFDETRNKVLKQQNVVFHDKIALSSGRIENNDLTVQGDVDSNYKLSKNKSPTAKFNKENCDETDKQVKNDEFKKKVKINEYNQNNKGDKKYKKGEKSYYETKSTNDESYSKKLNELRMKEHYLREKEKFLLEKEHDLMRKEIKLNKEKQNYGENKYEKKHNYEKETKHDSDEYKKEKKENYNKVKKDKYKQHNKQYEDTTNPKNKKYKYKEEKKRYSDHNQHKILNDESNKKRNISGQWYMELHKARNNIRQKEHASDWVFDRAQLRSMKRNKAHWYFQWMVDRARLRVK